MRERAYINSCPRTITGDKLLQIVQNYQSRATSRKRWMPIQRKRAMQNCTALSQSSLVGTNEWRCLDRYFAVHSQPGSTSNCQHLAALGQVLQLSLIHISEPTRLLSISYAVFCLK